MLWLSPGSCFSPGRSWPGPQAKSSDSFNRWPFGSKWRCVSPVTTHDALRFRAISGPGPFPFKSIFHIPPVRGAIRQTGSCPQTSFGEVGHREAIVSWRKIALQSLTENVISTRSGWTPWDAIAISCRRWHARAWAPTPHSCLTSRDIHFVFMGIADE